MTIQLTSARYSKSKAVLAAALNDPGTTVYFLDPSMFNESKGEFTGREIAPGASFPIVMDHPRRTRFATLTRRADGTFRVT
jgi:hypothetical protein